MNIRYFCFLMLDRGNMIKNQMNEIKRANEDDVFAQKLHEKCVSNLIQHVKETVPFYQNITATKLEDFPVVNKVMMKEDMSRFRSSEKLKIGKVRHTSGSTGIPFEILQDVRKAKRIQAEVVYYRSIVGDELGNKFINLISPSRMEKVSKISEYMQNVISVDVTKMDSDTMERLHKALKKNHSIRYMIGYESALEKIANYFLEKGYKDCSSLKAIVSSSEILTDVTIQKLTSVFGCPVYDRYSNEDNGFIAQTDGTSHDFLVNRASFYIEILKMNSDEPAQENELGRIVITDYYNYAQPFLRYDTGDLGAYSYKKVNGAKRYVLTKMAGRISDIVYDMDDRPVSTFAIGCALEVFSKIKQYQLIQNTKSDFDLNIIDPLKQYDSSNYQKALEDVLGKGIHVKVSYLDCLPTLNSGKFKRVICNYKPEN